MTARELWLFIAFLTAAILTVPALGGGVLWTRPLWTDEIATLFVVGRASPAAMIADISRGGDWSPPLLHLALWLIRLIAGEITPVLLRTFTVTCVAIALVLVFATLRRRSHWASSAAGALAVATHGLVVMHAFEGRFYGPWLLLAAAHAWSLGMDPLRVHSRRRDVAQAVAAALLSAIHWYGILSLGLMCLGAIATRGARGAHGVRWRDGIRIVAPSVAGVVTLLLCLPLALMQRSGASGVTWVPDLSVRQAMGMAEIFFFPAIPVLAVLVLLFAKVRQARRQGAPVLVAATRDPGVAALLSLAAMPLVLVVVSALVQPSMIPRYGIVTVLAWGPVVALAVETLRGAWRAVALVLVTASIGPVVTKAIADKRAYADWVSRETDAFERASVLRLPVVFHALHTIYPVAAPRRFGGSSARYLTLSDSTLMRLYPSDRLAWLRRTFQVERAIARSQADIYGFPVIATQQELDTTTRFVLQAEDLRIPGDQAQRFGEAAFPNHRVTRLGYQLLLFERVRR